MIPHMPGWLHRWIERHQNPISRGLHAFGIPMTVLAVVVAIVQLGQWRWDLWHRPAILLVGGYFLQWVGHRIEGNDMGEVILIKKWLNKPYVAISPKYADDT